MFNYIKGHMKEIKISDGTVSIFLTCNPLELDKDERQFLFMLVDEFDKFSKNHPKTQSIKGLRDVNA